MSVRPAFGRRAVHDSLRCGPEHVTEFQVYGRIAVAAVLKCEVALAADLAYYVERSSFPFGYLAQFLSVGLFHYESHALLTLIADNLLVGQGRVAYRQFGYVYVTADFLHQLGQAVQVAAGTVVVNRYDGVVLLLGHRAYRVVHPLLHLGVGSLYGIQLYGIVVFSGGYGRYGSSAHADAVVVTAEEDDVIALGRTVLGCIGHFGEAYTSCQHDDLVVAVFALGSVRILLRVLECLERAADKWLAELVAEVGGSVGCLDQNLGGCLVQPFARRAGFPVPSAVNARV